MILPRCAGHISVFLPLSVAFPDSVCDGIRKGLRFLSGLQTPEYANDIFVLTTAQAQAFDDAVYDKAVFKDRFVVVSRKSTG